MPEQYADEIELANPWQISPRILKQSGWQGEPPIIKRPNSISAALITPAERRAELCTFLALALVRSRIRDNNRSQCRGHRFYVRESQNPP
ncbi:hypothetical protein DRV85_15540 [Rhodosalinus halophilus]|uniref:Uncharacterized protein n=1 Tax=Rhodosalinus halophilus TaxID=2259333 RepID=A0A365U564_9RHOB|nr:hypothetical protein DRV85_15540 [Rhodosalinus halophilus]